MTFPSDPHHRRSLRLKGYDYTQTGAYFITICTQSRECLFGDIIDGWMLLNDAGQMIQSVWSQLPQYYPGIDVEAFVVMPNHIHGIIVLTVGGRPPCLPSPRATTGGCPYTVITGRCPSVQIVDHQLVSTPRHTKRLASIFRQTVATQLLRTYYPQRG